MAKRRRPVSFRIAASGRVSSTSIPVERVNFVAPSTNSNIIMVGDALVDAASGSERGQEIKPGGVYIEVDTDLLWWYVNVTGSDILTGIYFEDTEA